jgi:HEAT repeat protein
MRAAVRLAGLAAGLAVLLIAPSFRQHGPKQDVPAPSAAPATAVTTRPEVAATALAAAKRSVTAVAGPRESGARAEAAYALGESLGAAALPLLGEALGDPDQAVRFAAIEAIAGIGGDDAVLALAEALDAPDTATRLEVIDALGGMPGPLALQFLQQGLGDPDPVVRAAAAEWLAECGRCRGFDYLIIAGKR